MISLFPDGLYRDMPASDYYRLPRVSKSALDKLARSPAHMRAPSVEETRAMRIGKALHALALEGIAPLVRPEFSGKGSVAARAEWDAAHEGQTIISEDEAAQVHGMAAHIAMHPVAGPALRRADGIAEASILWTCEHTGAECKSRLDWLLPGIILDLKTTADARPDAFARSVATYRYEAQAAFYLQAAASAGVPAEHFIFVVVENAPPYAVALYQLDDAALEQGRRLYLRDLETYQRCAERDDWPAYPTDIQTLSLPRWAYRGQDDEQ